MPTSDQAQAGTAAAQMDEDSRPGMLLARLSLFRWSSFFFALLQSVCTAFIALNSIRFLVGIGAFAAATSALRLADRLRKIMR